MERWTNWIIAHRKRIVVVWVVLFALGGYATGQLGKKLSNQFSVPGADAQKALDLLRHTFNERGDGAFTLVATGNVSNPKVRAELGAAARRAATEAKAGHAGPVLAGGAPNVAYVQIDTSLKNADAADRTEAMRKAIGHPAGLKTYLSGYPAIQHDTTPASNKDLGRGEMIAGPVAIFVLAFMFGTLGGIVIPLLFAIVTIPTTLGIVFLFANILPMASYVENLVALIGIAIAIDYSMLVVFRFREELGTGAEPDEALRTTMRTAVRATIFSGLTVAIGLALLVVMPLPFMRSMGIGGLLVPLVSIAASATFLPAVLSMFGHRVNRLRIIPARLLARRAAGEGGMWTRLANAIMKRPVAFLLGASAIMIALAIPATGLHLTGGDNRGLPGGTEAASGFKLLERTLGPGALAPNQVAVDFHSAGGALTPAGQAAQRRLAASLRGDPAIVQRTVLVPAVLGEQRARAARLIDPSGRVIQIRAAGRTDAGTPTAEALVKRIRERYVPAAGFPDTATVLVGGAPAFGVDFKDKAYSAFPWLVVAVLIISYLLLLRAFRSVLLPLKAVLMNLLSVGATYGVLVLCFQHGLGADLLGLQQSPQIDAWIPIFLFSMLFGLSMDYEVFLLTRVREEWDLHHDNEKAVARGLEHTGRIITAAAIIMVAAFSGFIFGSFVGLQEFGIGLAAAILLDATIVRMLLVPAAMKLLGRWNWWLPEGVRKVMRLRPAAQQA